VSIRIILVLQPYNPKTKLDLMNRKADKLLTTTVFAYTTHRLF